MSRLLHRRGYEEAKHAFVTEWTAQAGPIVRDFIKIIGPIILGDGAGIALGLRPASSRNARAWMILTPDQQDPDIHDTEGIYIYPSELSRVMWAATKPTTFDVAENAARAAASALRAFRVALSRTSPANER